MIEIKKIRKENWLLQEGSGYLLSELDFNTYSKVWKEVIESCIENPFICSFTSLFINDGSQLMYNSFNYPGTATIVDPLAYEYTSESISELLGTISFKDYSDSLGNIRKLTLIDEDFGMSFEDCLFKNKYDVVFLLVKKPEDLTQDNLERIFTILEDFGCLFIQVPSDVPLCKEVKATLNHYFSHLSTRIRGSIIGSSQVFHAYRKIEGLI